MTPKMRGFTAGLASSSEHFAVSNMTLAGWKAMGLYFVS